MNKSESHGYYDGIGKVSKRVGYRVGKGYPLYILLFVFWLGVSVMASSIKARNELCDKTYPIERYFITNLFCEIKQGEHDESQRA